ncbi:MAG: sulfotransferase, partial [Flavobacteriales bacterium]|nr:sulfotransferase [Flavobacteriales bacterium]
MKISDIISEVFDVNKKYFKGLKEGALISRLTSYKADEIYPMVHASEDICFVLSTGRCGTKLLTNIFESHGECLPFHQPIPELLHFNKYAYSNFESKNEELTSMIDIARFEYIRKTILLDKHYIETNSNITFFAHQLAKLFPNSRFIHVIRKPEGFVKSGYSRGWYTGKISYDENKITTDDVDGVSWEKISQIGKIAWLWNETNSFVHNFKATLPENRILTVTSEGLFKDPEVMGEIFKFLSLAPLDDSQMEKFLSKKVNAQQNSVDLTE